MDRDVVTLHEGAAPEVWLYWVRMKKLPLSLSERCGKDAFSEWGTKSSFGFLDVTNSTVCRRERKVKWEWEHSNVNILFNASLRSQTRNRCTGQFWKDWPCDFCLLLFNFCLIFSKLKTATCRFGNSGMLSGFFTVFHRCPQTSVFRRKVLLKSEFRKSQKGQVSNALQAVCFLYGVNRGLGMSFQTAHLMKRPDSWPGIRQSSEFRPEETD